MKNKKTQKSKGRVILAGAGPGDPGLMTLRAAACLRTADAVVYDGLVSPGLLDLAPQAEKFYAGKYRAKKGKHCLDQNRINQLLARLAKQGKSVVRLKGGDPFIFGRGGEEASYLRKAGISFEIVPGVSAGSAVPAYAGIPVTDRRFASSVTFVTAHENPEKKEPSADWENIAKLRGTIVIFMGVQNLKAVSRQLVQKGKSPKTAVSVIEWGTTARQRTVSGTLADIALKAEKAGLHSPALTVIGEVNRLRRELDWFGQKPLSGKSVMVTRARNQAGNLKTLLEEKGASVVEFPVIEILPPMNWQAVDDALLNFSKFDWVVFTSANGVEFFFKRLQELGKDARIFSGRKIAVIGEMTGEALRQRGLIADLTPPAFTSESLVETFRRQNLRGREFLLARTDIAPAYLREELSRLGAGVTEAVVYRTVPLQDPEGKKRLEKWIQERKIDFITFTSSSTVKNFFKSLSPAVRKKLRSKLISIGPVTSQTLREHGYTPYREAKSHTVTGLVGTLTGEKEN